MSSWRLSGPKDPDVRVPYHCNNKWELCCRKPMAAAFIAARFSSAPHSEPESQMADPWASAAGSGPQSTAPMKRLGSPSGQGAECGQGTSNPYLSFFTLPCKGRAAAKDKDGLSRICN